ncbi:MAG: hypothetical protein PVF59_04445, partial [Desulfobacterales bacterium]
MSLLHEKMSETIQNRIETIRDAIVRVGSSLHPDYADALRDRCRRRDQQLTALCDWLLDTEQQQILALDPRNVFYLYAGAYLTVLASPSGHSAGSVTPAGGEGEVPDNGIGMLVREHWQELGLHDDAEAEQMAAICRAADGSVDSAMDDSHAGDMAAASTTVNRTLLAAGLKLARTLDLSGDYAQ